MMKKKLTILSSLFFLMSLSVYSQFQAGYSQNSNILSFKLRPTTSTTTGFALFEFFVRYPDTSPSVTYGVITANPGNFPNMTSIDWKIEQDNAAYTVPGYHVDHFYYTTAPITAPKLYNAGEEYEVISVPMSSAQPRIVNFELVHREPQDKFYLALVDNTATVDLSTGDPTTYFYPLTLTTPGDAAGSTVYYSDLAVVLPVRFKYLTVTNNNNSGILSWAVENENSNTEKYEVLISANGTNSSDFKPVSTLQPLFKSNGKSSNQYTFTQNDLSSIKSSGVIYFRIRQTDKDGKTSLSEIKSVRLNFKGLIAGVYPNPIKQFANVNFDLEKDAMVILSVTDALGKQLLVKQVQGFKGLNIKALDMSKVAGGSYLLKVQAGDDTKILPVVKAN